MRKTCILPVTLLLTALLLPGCGKPSPTMSWSLGQKEGKVALTLNADKANATTLLFESMASKWPADKAIASGTFQVAGEGGVGPGGSAQVMGINVSQTYGKGVARVSVNYCKFKIVEDGTKLEFLNETFPLGTKTIVVAADSTGRLP